VLGKRLTGRGTGSFWESTEKFRATANAVFPRASWRELTWWEKGEDRYRASIVYPRRSRETGLTWRGSDSATQWTSSLLGAGSVARVCHLA